MLYLGLTNFLFVLRYILGKQGGARKQIYAVVLFSLFLFSAFRYKVGCDWQGYYSQYVGAADFDWSTLTSIPDPIWWAILAWINASGLPYPVANVISSAIFFAGVHILARRQPDPLGFLVLLLPILIINLPMSGIRQAASIGLVCIAFSIFTDKRPLKYAIWVMLAAGFHSSAGIFILLLPFVNGRFTLFRLILSATLALPGIYFLTSSAATELAISRYVSTGVDAAGSVFRVGLLTLSGLYFLFFLRKKWLVSWPTDYRLVSIGAIGMTLALLIVPVSSVIADRFGYYLIPIQTMIFARLPFLPFRTNLAFRSALPYLTLIMLLTVWTQFSEHFRICYVPYQTWILGFPGGDPVGF
jgi:hypothetical protein